MPSFKSPCAEIFFNYHVPANDWLGRDSIINTLFIWIDPDSTGAFDLRSSEGPPRFSVPYVVPKYGQLIVKFDGYFPETSDTICFHSNRDSFRIDPSLLNAYYNFDVPINFGYHAAGDTAIFSLRSGVPSAPPGPYYPKIRILNPGYAYLAIMGFENWIDADFTDYQAPLLIKDQAYSVSFEKESAHPGDTVRFFIKSIGAPTSVGLDISILEGRTDAFFQDTLGNKLGTDIRRRSLAKSEKELCLVISPKIDIQRIVVQVFDRWHDGYSGKAELKIEPEIECVIVEPEFNELTLGETVSLHLKRVGTNGTLEEYPPGQLFDIQILGQGEDIGLLQAGGKSDIRLKSVSQPIQYIAPSLISSESLSIRIIAAKSENTVSISTKINQPQVMYHLKEDSFSQKSDLFPTILAQLQNQENGKSCSPESLRIASVTKLEVSADPRYLRGVEAAKIYATPCDSKGNPVKLSNDYLVNLWIHTDDENFGNLDSSGGSSKNMLNVPIGKLRNGKIKFVPDPNSITGRFPQGVRIGVSAANNPKVNGSTGVVVKGNSTGEYFTQNDSLWANSQYDTYIDTIIYRDTIINGTKTTTSDTIYHNIGDKGCAMTCMAMILKAAGVQIDPYSLNGFMVEKSFFENGNVKWSTVDSVPESSHIYKTSTGTGIIDSLGEASSFVDLSIIDAFLVQGFSLIAQVYNRSSQGHKHWILITAKSGADYKILDPGGYSRVTLKDYQNKVYRLIVYKQK
jgi:hypothetical protein